MTEALTVIGVLATWTALLVWRGAHANRLYNLELQTKFLNERVDDVVERMRALSEVTSKANSNLRRRVECTESRLEEDDET